MDQFDADAKRLVESGKLSSSSIKAISELALNNMNVGSLFTAAAGLLDTLFGTAERRSHGLYPLSIAQESHT
jgi:hypothetical protein